MDRLRPLPVGDEGSNSVGRNAEYCEEIYRRSKTTTFLTGLCSHKPTNSRQSQNRPLIVKIIAKNFELLNFLSDKHCNSGFSERSTNINNYGYALEYRTAEKIIKRNGMFLETTLEDDVTTVCVKMKATDNPSGVLKSMDETYFGNKFSSIGFVFGDVM